MTGYTVNTGSTGKFREGWDRIFSEAEKKGTRQRPKKKTGKKKAAASKPARKKTAGKKTAGQKSPAKKKKKSGSRK